MPLIETLIIGVGGAIAKGILKLWMKDNPFIETVGTNIIDMVKSFGLGIRAERSTVRQLDQIAERVAENIAKVFHTEGLEIEDARKDKIAILAGKTINNVNWGAEVLAEQNLDPSRLNKHLLSYDISKEYLTLKEKAFYKYIISESAQYIVDIATQLPSFTEKTFAEILKREDLILEKADLIIQEVQRIKGSSGHQDAKDSVFENNYRRSVVRRLDELQLFGVDLSVSSKRYRLSVAYVTLLVELSETNTDYVEGNANEEEAEMDVRKTVSVDRALAANSRLLIRGAAGSGKTTLLQWAAVMSASKSFTDELASWNDRIPFFIRLREFSVKALPAPSIFPSLISDALADAVPKNWVKSQMSAGRALLFIDGLDEISNSKLESVHAWLHDLCATYPKVQYVVTTRPYAVKEEWLKDADFFEAELQDMVLSDIEAFIDHWHDAVREGEQVQEKRNELDKFNSSLKGKIKNNWAIRRLATSPLLCAMICALHRDRVTNLPSDRITLYNACIGMFLRRDVERHVSLTDFVNLGERQKLLLLEDLAYWFIRNGWSEVDINATDERFNRILDTIEGIPPGTVGADIRKLFVERSSILRVPFYGMIDFPHRTFQEFLAAGGALEAGDLGLLIKNAHDELWREVVILAVGRAPRSVDAAKLLKGILSRADREKALRYRFVLLAASCLESVVKLPPGSGIKKKVKLLLAEAVPPKNLSQAKALAVAGDLVVPYLTYQNYRNKAEARACVRTLAIIGSSLAHQSLQDYMDDTSITIKRELVACLFLAPDPLSYAQTVFPNGGPKNIRLSVDRIPDITPLSKLINLRGLYLDDVPITDITPLASLVNIKDLCLSASKVTDLTPLKDLIDLEKLQLKRTPISDISPLANLSNLKSLNLDYTQVTDISPLKKLAKLQSLSLRGTNVKSSAIKKFNRKGLKIFGP